ncbi:MAG: hypothetical protein IJQ89_06555 [Bacteroidales bacterium]|nr:hypothetical protein [Bacteroidales bacterium]MBQ6726223.1 hypothetical protein [Bacteroidales bacterium]
MAKKTKISLSRLESFLKAQCDRLRTSMDAAESGGGEGSGKIWKGVKWVGLMERVL